MRSPPAMRVRPSLALKVGRALPSSSRWLARSVWGSSSRGWSGAPVEPSLMVQVMVPRR